MLFASNWNAVNCVERQNIRLAVQGCRAAYRGASFLFCFFANCEQVDLATDVKVKIYVVSQRKP